MADRDSNWWSTFDDPLREVIGAEDIPRLNVGLRCLFDDLRQAGVEFASGQHLTGTYLSLVAVNALLSLFRPVRAEGLSVPLDALESALWALDVGVIEPILKRPRPANNGRAWSPVLNTEIRGTAVYVVRRLRDFGLDREEALGVVAAELRRVGVKPERGRAENEITDRTVRTWCDDVSDDEKVAADRRKPAAKRYHALLSDKRNNALDQMPPETAKAWLRDRLRFFVRTLGGKTRKTS